MVAGARECSILCCSCLAGVALSNSRGGVFVSKLVLGEAGHAAGLRVGHVVRAVNEIAVLDSGVAAMIAGAAAGTVSFRVDAVPALNAGLNLDEEEHPRPT